MASTDTKAEPEGPVPPRHTPQPPSRTRRRWPLRLLILGLIVLGVPVAVLACLAFQGASLTLHGDGPNATAVGCPTQSPPFTDCYARIRVSVHPISVDPPGALRICCDYVAKRQSEPTLSITLPARTGARWSASDHGSSLTRTFADMTADGHAVTQFQYHPSPVPVRMDVTLSGTARTSMPILGGLISEEISAETLDWINIFAARLPPIVGGVWRTETTPAKLGISAGPARAPRDVVGQADGQDIVRISSTVDIARSVLFREPVAAVANLESVGTVLANTALPSPLELRNEILELAQALDGALATRERLISAAARIAILDGPVVSRLSRIVEETDRVAEAGRQCVALYRDLRNTLSRLDAALTTYAVALSTGLLTRHPDQFDHGCVDDSAEAEAADLSEDWLVLGLGFPRIETSLEDASKASSDAPNSASTNSDIESDQSRPARRPGDFLLSIASVTKSGARLDQLEAGLAETVAVRIGEATRYGGRDRGDVIRMLHRQWSHAGCWLYDTGDGAGTLTLHVEAQFPYLNHIAFRRAASGLITAIEITGVTLRDLSRTKRRNAGKGCQAFLDPIRITEYALWLEAEGTGARTPIDHALRLLEEGPGAIGALKLQ